MNIVLIQELLLSKKTLRCMDYLNNIIVIGSFDKKIYIIESIDKSWFLTRTFDFLDSDPTSIKLNDLYILMGLRNGSFLKISLIGDIISINNENSITISSIELYNNNIITGHWDGSFIIREYSTLKILKIICEHKYAVIVKQIDNDLLITSSQDGIIKLWNNDLNKITEVLAHNDIIRKMVIFQNSIYSCSNDGYIKIWDYKLNLINNLHITDTFLYTLAVYKDNKDKIFILTGGENKELIIITNIINNNFEKISLSYTCIIWDININYIENQILIISDDGYIRIFKNDILNNLNKDLNLLFFSKNKIEKFDIQKNSDLSEFPLKINKNHIKGKKEGDIQVFINENKIGEAHIWNNNNWEYIGEVIENKISNEKIFYKGDKIWKEGDYDYIFDIQIDKGSIFKLPFNKNDSINESTENFLNREQLSYSYKQQIIDFITNQLKIFKNIKNNEIEIKKNENNIFEPIIEYIFYSSFNSKAFINKLIDLNENIDELNDLNKILTKSDLLMMENLIFKFQKNNESLNEYEIYLLSNKLIKWNTKNNLIIMDLFRVMVLYFDSPKLLNNVDLELKYIIFITSFLKYSEEKYLILYLKLLANMCKLNGKTLITGEQIICESLTSKLPFNNKINEMFLIFLTNFLSYIIENRKANNISIWIDLLIKIEPTNKNLSENNLINYCIIIYNIICINKEKFVEINNNKSISKYILNLLDKNQLIIKLQNYLKNDI